jgi:hypothetical protein
VPTVSVLVGPDALGHRLWKMWNAGKCRRIIVSNSVPGLVEEWLHREAAFVVRAAEWVRRNTNGSIPEPDRMSAHDLSELWRSLPVTAGDPVASVAHRILLAKAQSVPFDCASTVRESGSAVVLAGLRGLFPEPRPAFLVCDSPLLPVIRDFERAAQLVPELPLAICVSVLEYEASVEEPSRSAAIAREGEIRLSGVSAGELTRRLRSAGVPDPLPVASIHRLTSGGLADETAEAYVAATVEAARPRDPLDPHRSASERFLFEQLESMVETAGLFVPNRGLEFLHGTKSAEADLVSTELRLAIEIDGAYYHLNAEQYRRDRRKDHAYQRHGYWVLRFLAEDVVADLEGILNTILEAVATRRAAN